MNTIPAGSLVACGEDKVLVIDPDQGTDSTAIIWSWSVDEVKDQLPTRYQKRMIPLDECKPIADNKKILLTSSGGATCILDVASRKVVFYAHTPMAHSADILPGGYVAVANSHHPEGNSLEIYHQDRSEERLLTDTLYSGHGVVWHPKEDKLFVLGFDRIKCYSVEQQQNNIAIRLEYTDMLPDNGGHDLSQIDDNQFLITTRKQVFQYDIHTRNFRPFDKLNMAQVKSINYRPDSGVLIFTKAEDSWWTHHIYLHHSNKTINLPFLKLYKVRTVF